LGIAYLQTTPLKHDFVLEVIPDPSQHPGHPGHQPLQAASQFGSGHFQRSGQRMSREEHISKCGDDTVDGCEILHQLKTVGGRHPMISRVSTCFQNPKKLVVLTRWPIHSISEVEKTGHLPIRSPGNDG